MDNSAFQNLMSDPRVKDIHSFDDLPAIRKITRFQAWALADAAGIPYPNGATRDQVVDLLERAISNGLNIAIVATKVLEKEQLTEKAKFGPLPLPVCIICGETIQANQEYGEGRNGKFHLSCTGQNSVKQEQLSSNSALAPTDYTIGELRKMAKDAGHKLSITMKKQDLKNLLGI